MAWAPSGEEVWFTATREGTRDLPALWAVSLSGKERLVTRTPIELFLDDISGDGKVLLTARESRAGMLCQAPGSTKETELGWLDFSWVEALSSDGKAILFGDGAGADPAVYLRASDGSPPVRLGNGIPRALSPDGSWVLATTPDSAEWLLLPTRTGTPRTLPCGPIVRLKSADWLDGRHLVLSGDEQGHPGRVYVQDIEGGAIRALAPERVVLPQRAAITPDGRAVLGMAGPMRGRAWTLLPVDGGDHHAFPALGWGDEPVQWSADGRFLYVARRRESNPETAAEIHRVEIATGRRELVRTLSPPDTAGVEWIERIVLTPDARSYCYTYKQTLGTLFVAEGLR
jgi:Tol biopolymer transport system component